MIYMAFLSFFSFPLQRSSWPVRVHQILCSGMYVRAVDGSCRVHKVPVASELQFCFLLGCSPHPSGSNSSVQCWDNQASSQAAKKKCSGLVGVSPSETVLMFSSFLPFIVGSCAFPWVNTGDLTEGQGISSRSSWKMRYLHSSFFFTLLVLLCLFVGQKAELVSWEVVGSLVLMETKEEECAVCSTETVPLWSLFGLIQL